MKKTQAVGNILLAAVFLMVPIAGCGGGSATDTPMAKQAAGVESAGEYDDHEDRTVVHLDSAVLDRLGLVVAEAGPGDLEITVELPAEVQVNGDRLAHVAPRVGGVVREVHVSLGDVVRRGQLLADLDSRELADAKAAYLAAAERITLADATFRREERLWAEKVTSEQDYLDARKGRAEARIELRAAQQKLHAVGVPQSQLEKMSQEHNTPFTQYRLTAPFDGTVINRHITIGETVSAGEAVFTVADLSTVWIDLSVYQKHLGSVLKGQRARVSTPHGDEVELEIDFVQPLVAEDTRAAMARLIAPNPDGEWHPGCFVTAKVTISDEPAGVVVPVSAVIRMDDGEEVIFVEEGDGFEPRIVVMGRRGRDLVEVVHGLEVGERYVAAGGFSLKAELGKSGFGDGHGH